MKRYLSIAIAALMVMFAVSCQKEHYPSGSNGAEVDVVFTAKLPSDVVTKAFVGEEDFAGKVYYEVYTSDWGTLLKKDAVDASANVATISLRLISDQTYNFLFWAQDANNDAIDVSNLKAVEIDYSKMANSDLYDAYCGREVGLLVNESLSRDVELTRPFAQLNIGANDTDTDLGQLVSAASKVTVSSVPDTYNVQTKEVSGAAEVSFNAAQWMEGKITVEGVDYDHIAMDYILPVGQNVTVDLELTATASTSLGVVEHSIPNVPLQANYRTNIIGALYTSAVDFEIIIDPIFVEPDNNVGVNTLADAFASGGYVTLDSDVVLTEALYLTKDVNVTVDLNGHTIKGGLRPDQSADDNNTYQLGIYATTGTLTIKDTKGEGKIETATAKYSIPVWAKGDAVVYIEGGYFANEGDGCEVIYASGSGKVYISGGYFKPTEKIGVELGTANQYTALNLHDGSRATADIVVTGGQFYGFDPANNLSEGANTNFVAEGYKTVNVGTATEPEYEVVVAPTIDADGNVTLESDGIIVNTINVSGATFDGNGKTLIVSENLATNHIISATGAATIKDVNIEGGNVMYGDKSSRALYFPKGDGTGDVIVENAYVVNVGYAFNTAGGRANSKINVSNSVLIGWSSFDPFASATFTNVHFGIGNYFGASSMFNGGLRPYSDVTLDNCTFENGFYLSLTEGATIKLLNCKVDGTVLTASNYEKYLKIEAGTGSVVFN